MIALAIYLLASLFAYQMMPLIWPVTYNWPNKMPAGALPKRIIYSLVWPILLLIGWLGIIAILIQRQTNMEPLKTDFTIGVRGGAYYAFSNNARATDWIKANPKGHYDADPIVLGNRLADAHFSYQYEKGLEVRVG